MNHDWQNWIDRLRSQDLTEAELREFQEAIESDPAKRDAYLDALLTEVGLEAADLPHPFATTRPPVVVPFYRSPRMKIAVIAAGITLLAAASYYAGQQQATPAIATATHVATITDADELAESAGIRIGQPLEKGPMIVPDGAEIGIAMRGGARLKIRGPADLDIDGPDKIRLGKGRISTYAPTYAHGFTVDTTDGKVVDLGTRFVTAAGTPSGTEVHVLEGLVEAWTLDGDAPHNLKGQHAAILKDGKLQSTEFLAQRLIVPLDPVLPDSDQDGLPDVVERYYGTNAEDSSSKPAALRLEESFASYPAGPFHKASLDATTGGPGAKWEGSGNVEAQGLGFSAGGASLKTTDGAMSTTGETLVGAIFRPDPKLMPPEGVTYLSFLMRSPAQQPPKCFAGLLLYQDDREELFIGKLSIANSYGSRLKQSLTQDAFSIPMDDKPHLFVVRIDRTRLVTDVFVDPLPGQPESASTRQFRYQEVPDFDRIALRSGSPEESFPSTFDEIRVGLSWDAVVPAAE